MMYGVRHREPVGFGVDSPQGTRESNTMPYCGLLHSQAPVGRFEVQGVSAGLLEVIYGVWRGFLQGTCRVWRGSPPGNQIIRIRCRIAVYSTLKLPLGVLKFRGFRWVSAGNLWGLAWVSTGNL